MALVIVAGAWLWFAKPWQPPIVVADPGPGGRRVTEGGLMANYWCGAGVAAGHLSVTRALRFA